MDPIARAMFMGSAGAGIVLPDIGASMEGGYFAGAISATSNGVATHGLIVAPAASGYNGESKLQSNTDFQSASGTFSMFDGAANTANMSNSNHPAANYCAGLTISGYSDWYLPARYELEIAFFNLKSNTYANDTRYGTNSYSVPPRTSNYSSNSNPSQTSVTAFQINGTEDFRIGNHWSSTNVDNMYTYVIDMRGGEEAQRIAVNSDYVRAFRKYAL